MDEHAEPSPLNKKGKDYYYKFIIDSIGILEGKYKWTIAIEDKAKENKPGINLAIDQLKLKKVGILFLI